jgi:hypothetical protein
MATLASSLLAGANSLAVDNTSTKAVDAMCSMKFVYSANVPSGPVWYGIGSSVDATNWGNPSLATDSAVSLVRPPQFPTNFIPGPGGSLYFPGSGIAYAIMVDLVGFATTPTVYTPITSIASVLGNPNVIPQKWNVFTLNQSGNAYASQASTYWTVSYTNT